MFRIVGTPSLEAEEGKPLPSMVLRGVAADPETTASHVSVLQQVVACGNAGDSLRLFALYTDTALEEMGPLPYSTIAEVATPDPLRTTLKIETVVSVEDLDDGRVAAVIRLSEQPSPDGTSSRLLMFIFANVDGRWLVDGIITEIVHGEEVIDLEGALATPVGTP